ncbi:MAG: aminopeptidase N [Arachnia sp.]
MSANLTQAETAARARAVIVHAYSVHVDVRDARDPDAPFFPVVSRIELTAAEPETWLDFIGEVDAVEVDGATVPFGYDGARIQLSGLTHGRCAVVVRARGRYSRTGEGLHRFVDPVDGETYLYTQYEPADARRVFPGFEQPDMRAPFTFALTGPSDWWLGSNQPAVSRVDDGEGVVTVEFVPTKPLSTYITCLCAGPYHRVEDRWGDMVLGLLCRRSLAPHLDADELFRETKAALGWYTANFGDYPWGTTYDQIFVPEYNLGAMENPGLVTFTESYLFRSAPTPAETQARCNTLVHEMSHMWFGDLVTCRWWGDLWLKESFAEFMGSHVSVEACGFADGWVNFAANRKVGAYLADTMPTTHPVVADIPDLEAAKTNFDRITYSKGSSALTQLVHYVGFEAFLRGSRRYFAAHAFGSGTLADFIAALAAETERDLSGWTSAWLETAGHDTLAAHLTTADGVISRLVVTRRAPEDRPADRPHATTVGLYRLRDGRLEREASLPVVIDGDAVEVEGAVGLPAPDAVLINDRDQTFAAVDLDPATRAVLVEHVGSLDPLARAVAWTSLWTGVRAARVSAEEFVRAVLTAGERQTGLLASLTAWALRAVAHYSPDASLAAVWRDGCRAAAAGAEPGSPEQLLWAKAYLKAASLAAEDVRWVLAGGVPGLALSVDVTWAAWETLSAQGAATAEELDGALAADDTAAGRVARLRCWAAGPDAAVKAEAWRRAHVVGGETNDAVGALLAGFNALGQAELRAPFARAYFDSLVDIWREHPIEIALRLVRDGFPDDAADAGEAWLAAHPDAPATLRRVVTEQTYEARIAANARSSAIPMEF